MALILTLYLLSCGACLAYTITSVLMAMKNGPTPQKRLPASIPLSLPSSGRRNHKSSSEGEYVLTWVGLTMNWNYCNIHCTQRKHRPISERACLLKNHSPCSALQHLLPKALEHSGYCITSVGSTFDVQFYKKTNSSSYVRSQYNMFFQ